MPNFKMVFDLHQLTSMALIYAPCGTYYSYILKAHRDMDCNAHITTTHEFLKAIMGAYLDSDLRGQ